MDGWMDGWTDRWMNGWIQGKASAIIVMFGNLGEGNWERILCIFLQLFCKPEIISKTLF